MSLPTPYVVQRLAYVAGAVDAHGNDIDSWADPVDVAVHGWVPPAADEEPAEAGRSPVLRDLDAYAPAGTVVAPKDRMTVDGVLYDVVGHVEDFTHGPWQWAAGVRINLKRVEG
jgi:hypothetical protein